MKLFIGIDELIVIAVVMIVFIGKDIPKLSRKLAAAYFKAKVYLQKMRDEIISQIDLEDDSNNKK